MHIEVLVEEQSAEEALRLLVPKIAPGVSFNTHSFNGKHALLRKLPSRLSAYARWLPEDWRIIVLIDEDRADCRSIKLQLENAALAAGLRTKSSAPHRFQVLNRLAIEELEAWFFGDVPAIRAAYPRVPATLGRRRKYRDPDGIQGGTWEALERLLNNNGYHRGGLAKIQAARDIAQHMDPCKNTSRSFRVFYEGLRALVSA